jgi:hypothetical protein
MPNNSKKIEEIRKIVSKLHGLGYACCRCMNCPTCKLAKEIYDGKRFFPPERKKK